MTVIFHSHFNQRLSTKDFESKLSKLPVSMRHKISKFRKWEDAHASLFGKLQLLEGFELFGVSASLFDLKYTDYDKPYLLNSQTSFNISHSGEYVVCIMSDEVTNVGIDIEEIKSISNKDFKDVWTDGEWCDIEKGDLKLFYEYWTRKEAVIKAHGEGLSASLNSIDIRKEEVSIGRHTFFVKTISLDDRYALHLASSNKIKEVELIEMFF